MTFRQNIWNGRPWSKCKQTALAQYAKLVGMNKVDQMAYFCAVQLYDIMFRFSGMKRPAFSAENGTKVKGQQEKGKLGADLPVPSIASLWQWR